MAAGQTKRSQACLKTSLAAIEVGRSLMLATSRLPLLNITLHVCQLHRTASSVRVSVLRLNSEQGNGAGEDGSCVSTKDACCCEVSALPKEFTMLPFVAEAWCIP